MDTFATIADAMDAGYLSCSVHVIHRHRDALLIGKDVSGYSSYGYKFKMIATLEFVPQDELERSDKLIEELQFKGALAQTVSILTGGLFKTGGFARMWSRQQIEQTTAEFIAGVDRILAMTDDQLRSSIAARHAVLNAEREREQRAEAARLGITWEEYLRVEAAPYEKQDDVLAEIQRWYLEQEQNQWA